MYPCAQVFCSSFITTLDRTFKVHSNYSCSFIYHTIYITEKYEVSGYPRSLPTTNNAATPITISLSCVRQEVLIVLTYNSTNYNSMQSSESSSSTWWRNSLVRRDLSVDQVIFQLCVYDVSKLKSMRSLHATGGGVCGTIVDGSTQRTRTIGGRWMGGRIIIIVSTSL